MNFLTFTQEFLDYIKQFLILRVTLLVLILLTVSFMINRTIDWFFKRSDFLNQEVEKTIQGVIRSSLKYGSATIIIIYLLEQFIDIKGILAGAGIAGLILGFAAQQMLKDILLGFVRLSDKEFRVGDFVTFNGTNSGIIEEIGVRFMQIREWSGKLLTLPHGEIRTIQNFNKRQMRVIERITVSYYEDPQKIKELLEEVCSICNEKYGQSLLRLEDGSPEEEFQYLGITNLNPNMNYIGYEFCIVGLVKPEYYFEISRNVRFEMMSAFHEHQIRMPASNVLYRSEKDVFPLRSN